MRQGSVRLAGAVVAVAAVLGVMTVLSVVVAVDVRRSVEMVQPQAHRAIYDLSLDHATGASGITSLDGRMVVEWRGGPGCDGYTSEQRVVTRSLDDNGQVSVSDVRLNSWEALDGNEFRYDRAEYLDSKLSSHEYGVAKRENGLVVLVVDDGDPVELPAKVLFPSAYNQAFAQALREGHSSFVRFLFDGAEQSASNVTAFIGQALAAPDDARKVHIKHAERGVPLVRMKARPVHMSYFDLGGDGEDAPDSAPNFEMGFSVFPNGIMSALELFYSDAVIKGELKGVEYFRHGGC